MMSATESFLYALRGFHTMIHNHDVPIESGSVKISHFAFLHVLVDKNIYQ